MNWPAWDAKRGLLYLLKLLSLFSVFSISFLPWFFFFSGLYFWKLIIKSVKTLEKILSGRKGGKQEYSFKGLYCQLLEIIAILTLLSPDLASLQLTFSWPNTDPTQPLHLYTGIVTKCWVQLGRLPVLPAASWARAWLSVHLYKHVLLGLITTSHLSCLNPNFFHCSCSTLRCAGTFQLLQPSCLLEKTLWLLLLSSADWQLHLFSL